MKSVLLPLLLLVLLYFAPHSTVVLNECKTEVHMYLKS